ncbi:MAG: hypothetical protein NW205_01850 [Hyphomicrobiaceae bacterium]|nr:hypothetical protein [Hyphomicrobiaceae bacterium]
MAIEHAVATADVPGRRAGPAERRRASAGYTVVLATLLFGAVTAVAVLLSTSESLLRTQFSLAIDRATTAGSAGAAVAVPVATGPVASAVSVAPSAAPVAGTEAYWLGEARKSGLTPVSLVRPLAMGDRMTLDGATGRRTLEVAALADLGPVADGDADGPATRLVLVTCREVETGRAMHFVVESPAGTTLDVPAAKSPHVL